jgi:glycine/D-amino acid oxidase-like deaminating enzyme
MDVAILGAGVVGCSAAAFLAEAGARVAVHDPGGIAAGASGRNSGVIQHPIQGPLVEFYAAALALHREVVDLPVDPAGVLVLGATSIDGVPPELDPQVVEDAHAVEAVVRPGIPAVRVNTGWIVGPSAVTHAWAGRARAAGATFVDAPPRSADVTLIATGAWTAGITPLWGVTAQIDVRAGHVLEQGGVNDAVEGAGGELFTLVGDVLGSSASTEEPDKDVVSRRLADRARAYIGEVRIQATRSCPRPLSPDGLPLVGALDPATYVCAGHGPWGVTVAPATSRMVADAILGRSEPPRHLDPQRFAPAEGGGAQAR